MVDALHVVMGVDLTVTPTIGVETALVLACESDPDLSRFPTPEHFCSWLTLTPGTHIGGGKPLKGAPAKSAIPAKRKTLSESIDRRDLRRGP